MTINERNDNDRLQDYLSRSLGMDDDFSFECQMCGNCCRNRSQPIALMGYDTFNIAKALGVTIGEVFDKYVRVEIGKELPFPTVYLKERLDSSCSLLRKGKCMVQQDKPVVCRVYPLGRMYYKNKFVYFTQNDCCSGSGKNKIKLKDWLENFNLEELDEVSALWTKMFSCCCTHLMNIVKKNKGQEAVAKFSTRILLSCYLMYDTNKSLMENIENNFEKLRVDFPKIKKYEKRFETNV